MERIRKLVVAAVGLVVLLAAQFAGIELDQGFEEAAALVVLSLLTAFGVYRVPNDPDLADQRLVGEQS